MEMYKEMLVSKKKPFVRHNYWNFLEHNELWRLRDNEAPPKKGVLIILDDDESDHEGGRNKGKPDGQTKGKGKGR
jgi:hypothetical protein